jgi:hypothetical protein
MLLPGLTFRHTFHNQLTFQDLLQLFLKLTFAGSVLLFLVDFFTYTGAIANNVYFSPLLYTLGIVILHLFIRWRWKVSLETDFSRAVLLYVVPLLLLMTTSAYILEEYGVLFPNYFFNNFKVHYLALPALAAGLTSFGVAHLNREAINKYGKPMYFIMMLWIIIGAAMFFLIDPETYRAYTREDAPIEYLTSLGFFIAGVVSLLMIRFKKSFASSLRGEQVFQVLCILIGLGFLLVAGEEISWGQRILGIETPEAIAEQNRQNEINLHNLETFWPYIYRSYQAIGMYGILASYVVWTFREFLPKKNTVKHWLQLLVPDKYLVLNFLMIVTYVWLRHRHGPWKYSKWEEFSELLLVLGICTHLIQRYVGFRAQKRLSK